MIPFVFLKQQQLKDEWWVKLHDPELEKAVRDE